MVELRQSVPGVCEQIESALREAGFKHTYIGIPPRGTDVRGLMEILRQTPLDRQIWGRFSHQENVEKGLATIAKIVPVAIVKNHSFYIFVPESLLGEIT